MRPSGRSRLPTRPPRDSAATVRSLLATKRVDVFAVVVENGSGDGSWQELQRELGSDSRVFLIRSETNTGFAGGNNLGIREALRRCAS